MLITLISQCDAAHLSSESHMLDEDSGALTLRMDAQTTAMVMMMMMTEQHHDDDLLPCALVSAHETHSRLRKRARPYTEDSCLETSLRFDHAHHCTDIC